MLLWALAKWDRASGGGGGRGGGQVVLRISLLLEIIFFDMHVNFSKSRTTFGSTF